MAPSDSSFPETRSPTRSPARSPVRSDAPWDLDAPWVLDPPSRLAFPPDEETALRRLLRALGRRVTALMHGRPVERDV